MEGLRWNWYLRIKKMDEGIGCKNGSAILDWKSG